MNMVSYNPFKPTQVKSLDHFVDELVGTTFSDLFGTNFVSGTPSVNIVESDTHFDIEVAAPGLSKEDFEITLEDDALVISGKKESSSEDTKSGKYTRREFNYQSFSRRFHLTDDLNKDDVSARYENGILRIRLAKTDISTPKTKTIEIG